MDNNSYCKSRLAPSQGSFLNFVRGCAALLVLFGHSVIDNFSPTVLFGVKYPWQSYGVVVFFWLSGFLIAYNCLVKKDYSFKEFFVDRVCRIYVMYIPVLFFSLAILLLAHPSMSLPPWGELSAIVLMLHHTPFDRMVSWLPAFPITIGSLVPLWTIAVEWWYYMFFGIVFFAFSSSAKEKGAMLLLAVPTALVVMFFALRESIGLVWLGGAASAFVFVRYNDSGKVKPLFLIVSILGAFLVYRFKMLSAASPVNMYDLQLMLITSAFLLFALLLFACVPVFTWFRQLASWLAFISYALYLSHLPVASVLTVFFQPGRTRYAITMVASLCVATILALLLENKHIALRHALKRRFGWGVRPTATRGG